MKPHLLLSTVWNSVTSIRFDISNKVQVQLLSASKSGTNHLNIFNDVRTKEIMCMCVQGREHINTNSYINVSCFILHCTRLSKLICVN